MIPYLPDGVYADLRTASNIRFQLQGLCETFSVKVL